MQPVPFNRPYATGAEFGYIREAIDNLHLSGNGPFSVRCAEWLEQTTGADKALLTHSCTGALEMSAMLIGIEPGDEVIMPSFTFVSTANAFVLRGGVPVFVDVREDTLNLDESLIAGAITDRTRAVVPVHYAGVACEMDAIAPIAADAGIAVIADAAQAIGSTYRDRPAGGLGDLAAVSFHETKNVICGEGGALLVNDGRFAERAEIVQEKGTNRSLFVRGQVDKYTWVDIGSSYPPSEINAAFLWAQIEQAKAITAERLRIWDAYHEAFAALEQRELARRPIVPEHCRHNAHMYYLLLPGLAERDRLIRGLAERGVESVFHYVPLHDSPAGRRFGRAHGSMAVTERAGAGLVRLPMWPEMGEAEIGRVVESVSGVLAQPSAAPSRT